MKQNQMKLMDIVRQEPDVEAFMSSVGASGVQSRLQLRVHVHEAEAPP